MRKNLGLVPWHVTMSLDGFIAGPEDGGAWTGPQFVLTHSPPDGEEDPTITFVTEDIRSAVSRAREAADGKNVVLIGASIARQCIESGLVDEILVHLVPILLGDGVRFFASTDSRQKITPFLWFDSNAEEAMKFYTSVFKNSKILSLSRYDEAGAQASGMPKGTVMSGTFELEGQQFMALNGGPHFRFSEAISFFFDCETQEEVDEFWEKLSKGGEKGQCGWIKDKFGVSWQIVPTILGKLLNDPDPEKSQRVMKAMLQMNKIDIRGLRQAYQQGS